MSNADSRWPCVSPRGDDATLLSVAVIPNAKRTEAAGLHDGALRVRLAAPAIDGRANEALIAWLAKQLGVPRRDVVLRHGASVRRKRLEIALDAQRIVRWLDALGESA
jgi:uncharacterized protein (TIGR00251 family)